MRIDPGAFGLAAGITAALLSTVCAALVALAPETSTAAFGLVIHMDLAGMAARMTWIGFFAGLLFWGLLAGVVFAFTAWLYDRMVLPAAAKSGPASTRG